ncbi:IclR family transcriptional regulator [Pseudonocardia sp.]|uniref:IclR family transcriptional regulator n=1 Tax=Pseudonocardia sp. TaxID=60912 RepID=UPI003D0A30FD
MTGVQSVARSLAVLERLATTGGAGVQELARALDLAPSTVQRLVGALVEAGIVEQSPTDRTYRVGLRLFQWGQAPLRRMRVREIAKPFMQELAVEVGETIALGVLDDGHVMHIEWIPARHLVQPRVGIGDRVPAHTSSVGRCLLAWLPTHRRTEALWLSVKADPAGTAPAAVEQQLAAVREAEFALVADSPASICTVAVPVRGPGGAVVGAIGIGGPATRFDEQRARALVPRLTEVGVAISAGCGAEGDQGRGTA